MHRGKKKKIQRKTVFAHGRREIETEEERRQPGRDEAL